MKKILVNTLTICYTETGSGRNTIVLLHGWGQSHTFWTDFEKNVGKKYHIYSLDLPGFGVSQEPPAIWDITDYASFLHQFITQIGIVKPTIVGHSFGGRIAIAYASTYPVHKLILYSNGGLPAYSLMKFFYKKFITMGKYIIPNTLYKSHSNIFKPKNYHNNGLYHKKRSKRMLDIYTHPEQDLISVVKKITTKTLIIVGKKDYITSPTLGQKFRNSIKNSQIVEIANATHFAHIETPRLFYQAVKKFLAR